MTDTNELFDGSDLAQAAYADLTAGATISQIDNLRDTGTAGRNQWGQTRLISVC